MFSMTACVVRAAFGAGRSDGAILAVPLIPAAAAADAARDGVRRLRAAWAAARRRAAAALRAAAERLDPRPVVEAVPVEGGPSAGPDVLPLPDARPLPMPAAAQVTAEDVPSQAEAPAWHGERLAELLAAKGSVRAAARELGIAESTLRGRMRKLGIQAQARKRS